MRTVNMTLARAMLLLVFMSLAPNIANAQTLQPLKAQSNTPQQFSAVSTSQNQATTTPNNTPSEPYKLSSRLHLQQGSNRGYLVVKMEMQPGSYIYSMTQTAPLRPSTITVADSRQFRLKGTFTPDRPPIVIEKDPIFEQRLEKHKGTVQFFVPIEVAAGMDPSQLAAELSFTGQVCTDQGVCMPISDAKSKGKFAGYFSSAPKRTAAEQNATDGRPQRTASQSEAANRNQIR